LFHKFNSKYDGLNEKLDEIIHSETALTVEQKRVLVDYFNLCAEEYMFYKSGHIDTDVWKSWSAGMRYYYSNSKIGEFWRQELETNSYYGLSVSVLSKAYHVVQVVRFAPSGPAKAGTLTKRYAPMGGKHGKVYKRKLQEGFLRLYDWGRCSWWQGARASYLSI